MKKTFIWLTCAASISALWAATSTSWETSSFDGFLKGTLTNLSLTSDGVLKPSPATKWNAQLGQPALWSLAAGPNGSVFVSTGHRGRVYQVDANGKSTVYWSADQPEVFALATDAKGDLYAGTSPNGAVFRIRNGKAEEFFRPQAKYIWALRFGSDGALYVGTGDQGRVYRIDGSGKGELYYETGQSNVTMLGQGPKGHLLAGTEPNGLLYEISAAKQGAIVLDAKLPEIRAAATRADGTIFVAAMGGSLAKRPGMVTAIPGTSGAAVVAATPTVVTVTEAHDSSSANPTQAPGDVNKPGASKESVTSTITTAPSSPVTDLSGVDKSTIYQINPDHTVEELRTSKEDNVYDLYLDGDDLVFSTDVRSRVYRLSLNRKTTLVLETGDGEATRLLPSSGGLWVGTSSPARVTALATSASKTAAYESQAHDARTVARWGRLSWQPQGASGLVFRTRTGNSPRPDTTWSNWSDPIRDAQTALITSPNARFIQWRAEWTGVGSTDLEKVTVPFLPQNTPPIVRNINVTSVTTTNPAKTNTATSTAAYTVTVTESGETPVATASGTTSQTISRSSGTQTQINWQAEDPDQDKLLYSLYFRGEEEKEWKLIRRNFFENTILLDPDVLADGRYFFRVVASDQPSNAPQYTKQAELVSNPVLIDNTPPLVTSGAPRRNGATVDIDVTAEDKTSSLKRCEYSLDAGTWQPLEAVDGVTDSPKEQFHLQLDNLRPGEHMIVFRVYDTADNAGLVKVVVR